MVAAGSTRNLNALSPATMPSKGRLLAPAVHRLSALSRDDAVERTLHDGAVATIIQFNVDRPQDCDRNAGCKKLLHAQYPSSQWDEDVGFGAARNIQ